MRINPAIATRANALTHLPKVVPMLYFDRAGEEGYGNVVLSAVDVDAS